MRPSSRQYPVLLLLDTPGGSPEQGRDPVRKLLRLMKRVGRGEGLLLNPAAVRGSFPRVQICFFVLCTQIRYKEEFEKNKGKGFSVVADTPELQRIKKTQDQISNVSSF